MTTPDLPQRRLPPCRSRRLGFAANEGLGLGEHRSGRFFVLRSLVLCCCHAVECIRLSLRSSRSQNALVHQAMFEPKSRRDVRSKLHQLRRASCCLASNVHIASTPWPPSILKSGRSRSSCKVRLRACYLLFQSSESSRPSQAFAGVLPLSTPCSTSCPAARV